MVRESGRRGSARRKTLKDVEATSGFSSTHISEIERGRTSPTIGALIRIAHALDKDPSYFIEERELDEVCITTPEDRPDKLTGLGVSGSGYSATSLTRGILGGRLLAFEMTVESNGSVKFCHMPTSGDLALTCTSGECRLVLGAEASPFHTGDSIHLCVDDVSIALEGDGKSEAHLLILMDPKEAVG